MRRNKIKTLHDWFKSDTRKPLVLRGARQVGKSTLVRLFAKEYGLRLIEINLDRKGHWNKIFETNDTSSIIREVEDHLNIRIDSTQETKDILFFDECQATPALLSALRYFYEDLPALPVITAGSLLEFTLEKFQTSLPVGRIEFMHLGPMTFDEFLLAKGEDRIVASLSEFDLTKKISTTMHEKVLRYQREYLFVGGMPEAVSLFTRNGDPKRIRKVLSEILDVYRDDFNKYSRDSMHPRLHLIIDYVLSHVGEKVKYSNISKDYEAKEIKKGIDLLLKAKIITKVDNTHSQGIPLKKGADGSTYKLIFLDVGLINVGLRYEWRDILNSSERELLHEGPLAEQFVGQHLRELSPEFEESELFYWLREGRSNAAEVDYLVQQGKNIIAIEVKSGATGSMRSLHQWNKDISHKYKRSLRFDLNPPSQFNIKVDNFNYELISLPLYLAAFNPTQKLF